MTTLHDKEVKVGDKVWDSVKGWTTVRRVDENKVYPIGTPENNYTEMGLVTIYNQSPQLFWQEFNVPSHAFEKPKVMVKKYMVLFENNGDYITTANHMRSIYYSSKEEFYRVNTVQNYKFVSLILESEIEVKE